jgi:AraC family transcriptional regulator
LMKGLGYSGGQMPYFLSPELKGDPGLGRICRAIRDEVDRHEFGREVLLTSLVTELAIYLFRHFSPFGLKSQSLKLDLHEAHWPIRRAMEYLQDNFNREFSLDRIAAAVGLSKYYLERVFKQATGLHLHTYMMILRLERAKQQLACGLKPIVEIALDLGFSDQSHFTNVFKRFTGMPPQAYRRGTK